MNPANPFSTFCFSACGEGPETAEADRFQAGGRQGRVPYAVARRLAAESAGQSAAGRTASVALPHGRCSSCGRRGSLFPWGRAFRRRGAMRAGKAACQLFFCHQCGKDVKEEEGLRRTFHASRPLLSGRLVYEPDSCGRERRTVRPHRQPASVRFAALRTVFSCF